METKRLYKSNTDKKLAGVCGGIAEYCNMDPTVVRILWIIAGFVFGSGLLAYIICAFIMPDKPIEVTPKKTTKTKKKTND